jgi:hypothetical protein
MSFLNPATYYPFSNVEQQQAMNSQKGYIWLAEVENTGITIKINNYDSTPYICLMKSGRNKTQHFLPMREKEYLNLLDCGEELREKLDECREFIMERFGKVIDDNTKNNSVLIPKRRKKALLKKSTKKCDMAPPAVVDHVKLEMEQDEDEE